MNKATEWDIIYLGYLRSQLCYWDNMKNDKYLSHDQAQQLIKKLMRMKGYI